MKPFRLAKIVLPALVAGVAFFAAWEGFVRWRKIKRYILPKPSEVWSAFWDNFSLIRRSAMVTGGNALTGLIIGTLIGGLIAVATNRFRVVSEIVGPLEVAARTIPIVVIVAVLNGMFALDTETARRIMVTIAVFFIVYVNVTRGLRQHDATKAELMESYAASPRKVMLKVRIPLAMPFFFTAVRIAAPVAVVTSFVAEYFGGRQNGLGYRITSAFSASHEPQGWAAVFGAALLGLIFFIAGSLLEYVALPWQRHRATR